MKILVINGPNLNLLGIREPDIYGRRTYADLVGMIKEHCEKRGIEVSFFQSNHEGALVDAIQGAYGAADGIVLNPAAYTHTSVALLDALKAVGIPTVEVHISDVSKREDFRQISYVRLAAETSIIGHGFEGYLEAMDYLIDRYGKKESPAGPDVPDETGEESR
jgi:3-dehydroquinate dehydratase-2